MARPHESLSPPSESVFQVPDLRRNHKDTLSEKVPPSATDLGGREKRAVPRAPTNKAIFTGCVT